MRIPSGKTDLRISGALRAACYCMSQCCARGRPIIVEWERDARHSAGLSLVRVRTEARYSEKKNGYLEICKSTIAKTAARAQLGKLSLCGQKLLRRTRAAGTLFPTKKKKRRRKFFTSKKVLAVVDDVYAEQAHVAGSFSLLGSSRAHVGGSLNARALPGARVHTNFIGCLKKVRVVKSWLFKLRDSPYCACDPAKIQDVLHVLEDCDMFHRERVALDTGIDVRIARRHFPEMMEDTGKRAQF
ncbi:hypothetical protein EVAR_26422_1 [Eumeta japonica]|uniref:Uncharacterized protein n=1 Tax=Eumeta variegata TaxID=151549 RepID=A0A4C1VNT2_EUMVA|nr:hypothetical protein EVAR_26422_1 [Eumeta japonica]